MIALLFLAALAADPPDEAAAAPVVTLREKVVEAIRNCPKPKGDEIVVCSRDRGIAESYRLPKLDPRFAEADPKLKAAEGIEAGGDAGFGTCSAVGSTAGTGCAMRDYKDWGDWKRRQRAARRAAEGGK